MVCVSTSVALKVHSFCKRVAFMFALHGMSCGLNVKKKVHFNFAKCCFIKLSENSAHGHKKKSLFVIFESFFKTYVLPLLVF